MMFKIRGHRVRKQQRQLLRAEDEGGLRLESEVTVPGARILQVISEAGDNESYDDGDTQGEELQPSQGQWSESVLQQPAVLQTPGGEQCIYIMSLVNDCLQSIHERDLLFNNFVTSASSGGSMYRAGDLTAMKEQFSSMVQDRYTMSP